LELSTGSAFEVVSQAFIDRRQGFLGEDAFRAIYDAAEEQSRMLSGLRKSLSGNRHAMGHSAELSTLNSQL
jgi:hypothetical protein